MLYLNWKLALVTIAVTPLIIAVAYRYSRISHPVLRDVQQKMADVATRPRRTSPACTCQGLRSGRRRAARFAERNERLFARAIQANRQQSFYIPLLGFVPLFAQAGVLLYGVDGDSRPARAAVVRLFAFLLNMLMFPLRRSAPGSDRRSGRPRRRAHLRDRGRAEEIAERPDARKLPDGPGEIRFEGVGFSYATDGLCWRTSTSCSSPARPCADRADRLGQDDARLLGARFYDVSAGRVLVDGADVRSRAVGTAAADRRDRPGSLLFSASVRENIAFGRPDASLEEVESAARLAQAHEFIEQLPTARHRGGERGVTLSGGQRQRLAIARALLTDRAS